jgi:hypothetical protein
MAIGSETPSLREGDRSLLMAMAPVMSHALKGRKPFCSAVSPAKQKMLSLRPRRLGGENSILDKYDFIPNIHLVMGLFLTDPTATK